MMGFDAPALRWRKSSRSGQATNCVEVASNLLGHHGVVYVRDSKHPDGPALPCAAGEWGAFLVGAKRGDFDL